MPTRSCSSRLAVIPESPPVNLNDYSNWWAWTPAEWEYAARGGLDGAVFAWGDEFAPPGADDGDTLLDRYEGTSPVETYPPNGYGLYDVAGNVWEWVSDWYRPDYYAELAATGTVARNPTGPAISPQPPDVVSCPAGVDVHIAADGPARFLQCLQERRETGLCFWLVGRRVHQHADPPRAPGLLRSGGSRRKRQSCRTSNKSDELSPLHSITSSARASTVGGMTRPKSPAASSLPPGSGAGIVPAQTRVLIGAESDFEPRSVALPLKAEAGRRLMRIAVDP